MEQIPNQLLIELRGRLERLQGRIANAAAQAGRVASSIRLVAVTKTVAVPVVRAAVELGLRDFGENRPEQIPAKAVAFSSEPIPLRWHMIGHFQSRKIKPTLPFLSCIHSVHSLQLLKLLDIEAGRLSTRAHVLLQVNVSGEGSKQGLIPGDLPRVLDEIPSLPSTSVSGLMTMAKEGAEPSELRRVFSKLRDLRDQLATREVPLSELSMGMSQDFEPAILEGSTMIRVGSALFSDLQGTDEDERGTGVQ